jgi:hypothetical protein
MSPPLFTEDGPFPSPCIFDSHNLLTSSDPGPQYACVGQVRLAVRRGQTWIDGSEQVARRAVLTLRTGAKGCRSAAGYLEHPLTGADRPSMTLQRPTEPAPFRGITMDTPLHHGARTLAADGSDGLTTRDG